MRKFLVKKLIINEGGVEKRLSLHYVDINDNEIKYFPFDKERAGYLYYPFLYIKLRFDGSIQISIINDD